MENITVLFEVLIKDGKMDDYLAQVAILREELAQIEGFLGVERFIGLNNPNLLLSKNIWKDEASLTQWRINVKHRFSQQKGRDEIFESYKITVVTPIRTYTLEDRERAPKDANEYFKS